LEGEEQTFQKLKSRRSIYCWQLSTFFVANLNFLKLNYLFFSKFEGKCGRLYNGYTTVRAFTACTQLASILEVPKKFISAQRRVVR